MAEKRAGMDAFKAYEPQPDIAKAATLPASLYAGQEVYQQEKDRIFWRTWQVVGRSEEVQRPGDFFTTELYGEPILVSRGTDGTLRAFYNVCRHRAGAVACGKGNRKVFQCQYHGWTYDLGGKLLRTPEFEGVECFDKGTFGLQPVGVEQWGPMILVNLDPQALPLKGFLGEIIPETQNLPLDRCRLVERRDYSVECNWKVYVENYLEGYHIPIAHPGLYRELDYSNYRVETRRYHSRQLAPLRPFVAEGPPRRYAEMRPDEEVLYYWVFPNLMLNFYPDNLSLNLIVPQGPDRTLTIFEWYMEDSAPGAAWESVQQGIAFSDEIQQEDIGICESVQRGLGSRCYRQGRLSPRRENGVHHFQLLYHELMQAE